MADTTRRSSAPRPGTGVEDSRAADERSEPDNPTDLPKGQLRATVKRAFRGFKRDNLTDLAAGLTYYGVLSVLPGHTTLTVIAYRATSTASDFAKPMSAALAPA